MEKIARQEPQATVIKDGLAVSRNSAIRSKREVAAWLRRIGVIK
jgi:hypothetical protein